MEWWILQHESSTDTPITRDIPLSSRFNGLVGLLASLRTYAETVQEGMKMDIKTFGIILQTVSITEHRRRSQCDG